MTGNFRQGSRGDKQREMIDAIAELASKAEPMRIKLEQHNFLFNSPVSIKDGMLVFKRPHDLEPDWLKEGSPVSFSLLLDDSSRHVIKTSIVIPEQTDANSEMLFCSMASEFEEHKNQRIYVRYDTTKFNNLFINFATYNQDFRLWDISCRGAKIYMASTQLIPELSLHSKPSAKIIIDNTCLVSIPAVELRYIGEYSLGVFWELDHFSDAQRHLSSLTAMLADLEQSTENSSRSR